MQKFQQIPFTVFILLIQTLASTFLIHEGFHILNSIACMIHSYSKHRYKGFTFHISNTKWPHPQYHRKGRWEFIKSIYVSNPSCDGERNFLNSQSIKHQLINIHHTFAFGTQNHPNPSWTPNPKSPYEKQTPRYGRMAWFAQW